MTENNEENRDSQTTDPLNGLNDKDRKETEEILAELDEREKKDDDKKSDDKPDESKKSDDEKKPDESKEGDDKKKPDDGKKDDDKSDDTKRRDPKMIPAWQKKIEEKKNNKTVAELEQEIADLKAGNKPDEKKDEKSDAEDELVKLAEAFDAEPEKMAELVKYFEKKFGGVSPEIQAQLDQIDEMKRQEAEKYETAMYNSDFEKQILPLLKAEYGDDVPQDVIDKVNAGLKELAYSDDYLKVPYDTLYKGFDQFRDLVPAKKKSAEGSRGGSTFAAGQGAKDYENVTEAEIKAMSDEEFAAYSDAMSKKK